MKTLATIAAISVFVLSGCGSNNGETAALTEERTALQTQVSELKQNVDSAGTELDKVKTDLAEVEEELKSTKTELIEVQKEATSNERRATTAEKDLELIRTKYDSEIRAELSASWATAVEESCAAAGNSTNAISSSLKWDDELEPIGSRAEMLEQVEACAEPLRARSAEEKLSAECELVDSDAIVKAPDALKGECFYMFVVPVQWDSRTGECSFLGRFGSANRGTRSYRYDDDALFIAPDDICEDALADADQDDLMKVWADVNGPYKYDTAAGGTNEVPLFEIRGATVLQKG